MYARKVRLDFIFVVALKHNRTPHTDLTTRMRPIFVGVVHFRNIDKFYFWKRKKREIQMSTKQGKHTAKENLNLVTRNQNPIKHECKVKNLPQAALGDPTWPDKLSPKSIMLMTQEVSVIPYPSSTWQPKHLLFVVMFAMKM